MDKNIWEKDLYYQSIDDTHSGEYADNDTIFKKFIAHLQGENEKSILDVGCGEGWLIEQLSKRLGDTNQLTGIEVSATGLKMAKERDVKNSTFIQYDGELFPFADATFDIALSTVVFEHLAEPLATFKEMDRVVKRGGKIMIACPNFGSPLFKSPCNKNNRAVLMVTRFLKEFIPKKYFKDDFHWDNVTPIELPENVHIADYDTLSEPSLSFFEKFLSNNKNRYRIIEIDSLWDTYVYEKVFAGQKRNFLKYVLVNIVKFLGIKKILRFQYFGSFFFVVIEKL